MKTTETATATKSTTATDTAVKSATAKTANTTTAVKNKPSEESSDTKTTAKSKKSSSEFCDFFIDQLKDIYWAEKHIAQGLKKMCPATTNGELRTIFEQHLADSTQQIERIKQLFELMDKRPSTKVCAAMEGLLKEAEEVLKSTEEGTFLRDAALIMAAQKIEHYEIATYGTLCVLAGYLPEKKQLQAILKELLDEEKKTDTQLTKVAESTINRQASKE